MFWMHRYLEKYKEKLEMGTSITIVANESKDN